MGLLSWEVNQRGPSRLFHEGDGEGSHCRGLCRGEEYGIIRGMRKMNLKAKFLLAVSAAAVVDVAPVAAQQQLVVTNTYGDAKCVVNYDESRIGPYALEDPLTFADGRKVRSAADWEARRA